MRCRRSNAASPPCGTGAEPAEAGYASAPFVQGARDILGEHVTVQIAKRSELQTFKVMPKR